MSNSRLMCMECRETEGLKVTSDGRHVLCSCGVMTPLYSKFQVHDHSGKLQLDQSSILQERLANADRLNSLEQYEEALEVYDTLAKNLADNYSVWYGRACALSQKFLGVSAQKEGKVLTYLDVAKKTARNKSQLRQATHAHDFYSNRINRQNDINQLSAQEVLLAAKKADISAELDFQQAPILTSLMELKNALAHSKRTLSPVRKTFRVKTCAVIILTILLLYVIICSTAAIYFHLISETSLSIPLPTSAINISYLITVPLRWMTAFISVFIDIILDYCDITYTFPLHSYTSIATCLILTIVIAKVLGALSVSRRAAREVMDEVEKSMSRDSDMIKIRMAEIEPLKQSEKEAQRELDSLTSQIDALWHEHNNSILSDNTY